MQSKWVETKSLYINTQYTWGDRQLAEELLQIIQDGGGGTNVSGIFDDKKKKKVIKLICKVNEEIFSEEKFINNEYNVTIKDINIVIKEVLGIDVKINDIK